MRTSTAIELTCLALLASAVFGVASAQLDDQAPRGQWDTVDSTGDIILDGSSYYRVYQGERDIAGWRNVADEDVEGALLEGESGAAEGELFELASVIQRDQATGKYSGEGVTARVMTPIVQRMEIYNGNGYRISTGGSVVRDDKLLVYAESNFEEAEDLELTVRNPEDTDVTREVLSTGIASAQRSELPDGFDESYLDERVQGVGTTGFERGYWLLDVSNLERGRHTVAVEGVEDLDFDRASRSFAVDVGDVSRYSLVLDRATVSQGENVRFDVTGSEHGQYHAVAVDRDRVRGDSSAEDVFRDVGDTVETGATSDYAYAVVEIGSGGGGAGQIDSSRLTVGTASIRLYEARDSVSDARDTVGHRLQEVSDRELDVEQGHINVGFDGITYVTGQSIDIRGTASPDIDRVALYVRDRDDWQILPLDGRDTHAVADDGSWGARNVVLSEEAHGGRLFRFPGSYSIAAVDADDLDSPPQRTITPAEFNRLTTSRTATRVTGPSFDAGVRSYGGQVAVDDRVSFSGVSAGPREIAVAFVSERGRVTASTVRTNRGNLFEDVNLDTGKVRQGRVTMLAISPGRDGVYGDGSATDGAGASVDVRSPTAFRDYLRSFDDTGRTMSQILSRARSASVDRAGSDDLVRTQEFRVTSPRTMIRDVVPTGHSELEGPVDIEQGERMVVRGHTNRNPTDTQIDVEIEGADTVEDRTITGWSETGLWSTGYSTSGLATGEYTVHVDDGRSTDSLSFDVVDARADDALDDAERLRQRLDELHESADELEETNEELRDEIQQLETERQELMDELNETREEASPGFTAASAVLAVLAVAFAAGVRRR